MQCAPSAPWLCECPWPPQPWSSPGPWLWPTWLSSTNRLIRLTAHPANARKNITAEEFQMFTDTEDVMEAHPSRSAVCVVATCTSPGTARRNLACAGCATDNIGAVCREQRPEMLTLAIHTHGVLDTIHCLIHQYARHQPDAEHRRQSSQHLSARHIGMVCQDRSCWAWSCTTTNCAGSICSARRCPRKHAHLHTVIAESVCGLALASCVPRRKQRHAKATDV